MALLIWTRRGVCGPSADTAPLVPRAVIEPGPLEINKPTKKSERSCLGESRSLSGKGQKQKISHRPAAEALVAWDAPEAAVLMVLSGN